MLMNMTHSRWRLVAPLTSIAVCSALVPILAAQSAPDLQFGGHTLGEPAEAFFKIAKPQGSQTLTRDYCKSLLDDPKTDGELGEGGDSMNQQGVLVLKKSDFATLDASNCRNVVAAIKGEQANVGMRLASELGKGAALFHSGRLAALNLVRDTPYSEAISDMERRFGGPGKTINATRIGWPNHEEIQWEKDGVFAAVWRDAVSNGAFIRVGYLKSPYNSWLRAVPTTAH